MGVRGSGDLIAWLVVDGTARASLGRAARESMMMVRWKLFSWKKDANRLVFKTTAWTTASTKDDGISEKKGARSNGQWCCYYNQRFVSDWASQSVSRTRQKMKKGQRLIKRKRWLLEIKCQRARIILFRLAERSRGESAVQPMKEESHAKR